MSMPTAGPDRVIEGEVISSTTYGPSTGPGRRPITIEYLQQQQRLPLPMFRRKSVFLAGVFGLLLGPIGMLYATFFGAFVMGFVTMVLTIVTLGHASLFAFPVCAAWAMSSAYRKNQRVAMVEEHFAHR